MGRTGAEVATRVGFNTVIIKRLGITSQYPRAWRGEWLQF
jgi:hypothetical protein